MTATRANTIPVICHADATSEYNNNENRNGITIDNLFATDATATPMFFAVYAIILKSRMKVNPISTAHGSQGCWKVSTELNGNDPLITEPVITQVQ